MTRYDIIVTKVFIKVTYNVKHLSPPIRFSLGFSRSFLGSLLTRLGRFCDGPAMGPWALPRIVGQQLSNHYKPLISCNNR